MPILTQAAVGLAAILGFLAAYQCAFAVWFAALVRRPPPVFPPAIRWPRVAILLALRGADPQLRETLRRLIEQDYPEHELYVIVDSRGDAAWEIVAGAQQEFGRGLLHLAELTDRRATCGLQCSAFAQAARALPEAVEVVVTVDGDLLPHSQMLLELVAPLQNERVAATFGNRWFLPRAATFGSLVRYLWNVAAVVPMHVFGIPWGGCMAVKRQALVASGILEKWPLSIVHDGPVPSLLATLKLQAKFVPTLMMPIRESCSLGFCLDFLKRQMMWTRLYHPNWWAIMVHAVVTTGFWVAAAAMVVVALDQKNDVALAASVAGVVFYEAAMLVSIFLLERAVAASLIRRGETAAWMTWSTWLKLPLAIPLTQFVYLIAATLASVRNRVTWRGVSYRIHSRFEIQRLDDKPFEQEAGSDASL